MKIIALEKEIPGISNGDFKPLLRDETKKVIELYEKGIIREIYFRSDVNEAVLILECDDVEQAKDYLGTLPLVKHKLIDFDLIPLKPYPGFSRLVS